MTSRCRSKRSYWWRSTRLRPIPWQLIGLGLLALALLLFPSLLAAAVIVNLLLWLSLAGVRLGTLLTARRARRQPTGPCPGRGPRVTIHVPCYSEPPEVVKRTLSALARLDWPDYEVICLDNNTTDPALWEPIRQHCAALGERFRFYHIEGLRGAKAGALQLALSLTDLRTELIAVVDADYRARPDFLQRAWAHLSESDVAFVQFPQAYDSGNGGLGRELAHYFDVFMPAADSADAALLTGTMSVIRRDALEAVGGWSSATITEDAELGLRLLASGYRGRYDGSVVGRGLMPADLSSLRAQRRRWVRGNSDTLYQLGPLGLARLGVRRGLAVLAQLTAWFNFLLVPVAALCVIALSGLDTESHRRAAQLAGVSIVLQLAFKLVLLAASPTRVGKPGSLGRKLLAHLGLSWEGATAWLERLTGTRLAFVRTSKLALPSHLADAAAPLTCAVMAAAAATSLFLRELPLAAFGAALAALAFASVVELRRQLASSAPPSSDPSARPPITSPT